MISKSFSPEWTNLDVAQMLSFASTSRIAPRTNLLCVLDGEKVYALLDYPVYSMNFFNIDVSGRLAQLPSQNLNEFLEKTIELLTPLYGKIDSAVVVKAEVLRRLTKSQKGAIDVEVMIRDFFDTARQLAREEGQTWAALPKKEVKIPRYGLVKFALRLFSPSRIVIALVGVGPLGGPQPSHREDTGDSKRLLSVINLKFKKGDLLSIGTVPLEFYFKGSKLSADNIWEYSKKPKILVILNADDLRKVATPEDILRLLGEDRIKIRTTSTLVKIAMPIVKWYGRRKLISTKS
jgi:hypothetical protein